MRLKTILLFGVIGLFVSAPMLFNKANQNQPAGSINGQWQPLDPGQAWQPYDATFANKPKAGFLSWLFGSGDESAVPQQDASPFQLAGSRTVMPDGTIATSSAQMTMPGSVFSQPVYQPFTGLNEFLRFDVSPYWVKTRWPRVSTFPGPDSLTAMRVALVSGPRPVDIHGSLTYYFDNQQRPQRITFQGWTGDATELAGFVEQNGLTRRNTNGAALFNLSSWGTIKGALRLDHPPVASQDLPNEQLMVLMELTNPNGNLGISQQTESILNAMEARQ